VDKPVSSIRGTAHGIGAFGETAELVLGAMTTYDLDKSTLTGRQLIPRDEQGERNLVSIDIDSPKQSPNLTFTMCRRLRTFVSCIILMNEHN